jgi:LPXTG-site transpeptidase (sortase) family protein
MKRKISLKWSLLTVGTFGITAFLIVIFFFFTNVNQAESVKLISALPKNLIIPSINVKAIFESVGLTSDGSIDTPKNPAIVGWFNQSPLPGEKGSSIILGHFGWKSSVPAVFDNLYKVKKGDKIYIQDNNGLDISFVVKEIKWYDPKADAKEVFVSSDGLAHLNIITCEGIWDETIKSYSERMVVFADMEM